MFLNLATDARLKGLRVIIDHAAGRYDEALACQHDVVRAIGHNVAVKIQPMQLLLPQA